MQHDTSPHPIVLGGKKVILQCASLVMAYSRKLYMQYYPCFTALNAGSSCQSFCLYGWNGREVHY